MRLKSAVYFRPIKAAFTQLGFSADASAATRFTASQPSKINVNLEVLPLFLAAAAQGDFLFMRSLSANTSTSDDVSATFQKVLSDSAPLADTRTLSAVKRNFETTALVDSLYFEVAKSLFHAASASDSPHLVATKPLPTDAFSTADSTLASVSKPLEDSALLSEGPVLRSSAKSLLAASQALDGIDTLGVDKLLGHSASTTDTLRFDLTRTLFSGVSATDDLDGQASTLDDQTLQFVKALTHVASFSDIWYNTLAKYLGDTGAVADEGELRSQGYAEFSYFESDFVGAARTF